MAGISSALKPHPWLIHHPGISSEQPHQPVLQNASEHRGVAMLKHQQHRQLHQHHHRCLLDPSAPPPPARCVVASSSASPGQCKGSMSEPTLFVLGLTGSIGR